MKGSEMRSLKVEPSEESSGFVNFYLLILFIAVFFGIAAREAKSPSDVVTASNAPFSRNEAARQFDLSSREVDGLRGPIGSRTEKFEVPATGK